MEFFWTWNKQRSNIERCLFEDNTEHEARQGCMHEDEHDIEGGNKNFLKVSKMMRLGTGSINQCRAFKRRAIVCSFKLLPWVN